MHPTDIVIVFESEEEKNIICATIAYSLEEAEKIAKEWENDGVFFVQIVSIDYSMRRE